VHDAQDVQDLHLHVGVGAPFGSTGRAPGDAPDGLEVRVRQEQRDARAQGESDIAEIARLLEGR
jgi:hypothetical protein